MTGAPYPDRMETITVKLPAPLHARLATEASRRHVTKSQLVRDCLNGIFTGSRLRGKLSCHELAKDLAGSLRGPRDLATNPRHLKGFGR